MSYYTYKLSYWTNNPWPNIPKPYEVEKEHMYGFTNFGPSKVEFDHLVGRVEVLKDRVQELRARLHSLEDMHPHPPESEEIEDFEEDKVYSDSEELVLTLANKLGVEIKIL